MERSIVTPFFGRLECPYYTTIFRKGSKMFAGIVVNPDEPINTGDVVLADTILPSGKAVVTEIVEERPSRGNYEMFTFEPIYQLIQIEPIK